MRKSKRKKALVSNTLSDSVSSVYYNDKTRTSAFPLAASTASSKKTLPKIVDSDDVKSTSLSSILQTQKNKFTAAHASTDMVIGSFATGPLAVEKSKKKRVMRKNSELLVAGESLAVVPANLTTYISLIEDRWFGEGVRAQVEAFKEGLEEVVPLDDLRIFSPSELRLLFCGDAEVLWDEAMLSRDILVPTGSMTHDTKLFQFLVAELVANGKS